MARIIVPAAEALLDQEVKVLNHGFVRLVDYMGGDQRIVQAARVSYGAGTKTYRQDRGLINYLMKNLHTSPFEQVQLTFHTKMPIFVARQWVRHRTARLNEVSGRYSVMTDEFYVPEPDELCYQSSDNRQGGSEVIPFDEAMAMIAEIESEQKADFSNYMTRIDGGMAREMARLNLPLSLYTEWYWQIDLHNLFHFLWLRLDAHAQRQIRVFAEVLATCAQAVAPMAWEAFEEHRLEAMNFSRSELIGLQRMLRGEPHGLTGRDVQNFERKLERISRLEPRKVSDVVGDYDVKEELNASPSPETT